MLKLTADVSQWQGEIAYWVLVPQVEGVIVRVSTGVQEDTRFEVNDAGVRSEGLVPAVYAHVSSWINGVWQAEAFLLFLGDRVVDHILVDVEENAAGLSQSALRARVQAFIETVRLARPEVEIRIYTRGYWWNVHLGDWAYAAQFPLHVARYSNTAAHPWDADPASPLRPLPWFGYVLWQRSADGNGLGPQYGVSSDDIDLSWPSDAPPGQFPPPGGDSVMLKALVQGQSFRLGPSVAYSKVGSLEAGEMLSLLGMEVENASRVWVRVRRASGQEGWAALVYRYAWQLTGKAYLEVV